MTEKEVVEVVNRAYEEAGNMRTAARDLGISLSYLADILKGRRKPGDKVLKALGIERKVIYVMKQ